MDAPPELVNGVLPAVVSIEAAVKPGHPSTVVLGTERRGTGVIVDTGGYLLTVNYVVIGAYRLGVGLTDGRRFQAHLGAREFDSGRAGRGAGGRGVHLLSRRVRHPLGVHALEGDRGDASEPRPRRGSPL